MLRINSLQNASDYYTKSLSRGDYYSEQSEIKGEWKGLESELLKLDGTVNEIEFSKLCNNINPNNGNQLSARQNDNRREAYDFTFSVPKSVSIQHAISLDDRILDVIKSSVFETMEYIEADIQTRVRVNGLNENRVTANMSYAYFLHKNSRPVDGYSDPHLHVHAVVMNLTYDFEEHKWKAIEMRDKFENREYYQAIFNSKVASKLQALGYEIQKTDNNFELVGFDSSIIKQFSRRTTEINEIAESKNILNEKTKGELGARTRSNKSDKLSQSNLREKYLEVLKPEEKLLIESSFEKAKGYASSLPFLSKQDSEVDSTYQNQTQDQSQNQKWLDYTLEKTFERYSTVSEKRLIGEVLMDGIGQTNVVGIETILENYKTEGILIPEDTPNSVLESRVNTSRTITTQRALNEEKSIVENINSQKLIHNPLNSKYAESILVDTFLNQNQKEVVSNILLSRDGINLLEGKAGTGKTTVLKSIEAGCNQNQINVLVLAPTTKAVEVLQKEGFTSANTIQKYLSDTEFQKSNQNNHNTESNLNNPRRPTNQKRLIIVDEASLVSIKQMNQLLNTAKDNQNRVLLVGDTKQHKSVERGNTLKIIQDHSKIQTVSLTKILRQNQTETKQAVEYLSNGNTLKGLEIFEQLNFIQEIPEDTKRLDKLASTYRTYLSQKESVLVITPTHSDGNQIHTAIRNTLKQDNLIDSSDYTFQTLRTLSLTTAEKGLLDNFKPDQVIQFTQNTGEFKKGERFTIVVPSETTNPSTYSTGQTQDLSSTSAQPQSPSFTPTLKMQNSAGKIFEIPIHKPNHFEVYQTLNLELSKGDKIQVLKQSQVLDLKGRDHKTTNGAFYTIKNFNENGDIVLNNNWILPKTFGHLKSGYYTTSYSSQGQTVDHSIFYTSNQSLPVINQDLVYVANSRFKKTNLILTPNIDEFKTNAHKQNSSTLALDITTSSKSKQSLQSEAVNPKLEQVGMGSGSETKSIEVVSNQIDNTVNKSLNKPINKYEYAKMMVEKIKSGEVKLETKEVSLSDSNSKSVKKIKI